MELIDYFQRGLRPEAYEELLDDKQRDLHALHARRAAIEQGAVEAVRSAGRVLVLVITEPWCGDSLAIFPVVLELFRRADCEIRVVRRDEHLELIERYLTHGGRAIPIVVVLDEAGDERFHWGPRPAPAQRLLDDRREAVAAGAIEKSEIHKEIRVFYAEDRGQTIVEEFVKRFEAG
jgi:hypothetical protein